MLSKTKLPGMQASMFQARINWEGCGRKGIRRKKWTDDRGRGTNRPDGMASRWIVIAITHMPSKMYHVQEAQLSPRDRTMRRVSWNLANCHATLQKLLVRQVLNKSKLWSWRVKVGRCVINMCTQPWCIQSLSLSFRCHKQTDDGQVVYITCIPTTCCGEIF